ncbi:MAG: carbamoyltransferase HypF [Arcobacteraceae bacterium]
MTRYLYKITGIVQGVGFRPFIYKLSINLGLTGFVFNDSSGVTIELEGDKETLQKFEKQLYCELPPLATINSLVKIQIEVLGTTTFQIIQTQNQDDKTTLVSPDMKICDECLEDIKKDDKYHNYFATNCTNCGPRYSIIKTVPYDRINTSMDEFEMCESCKEDYTNPLHRRYHAQPISCNNCGPQLTLSIKNKVISTNADDIYHKTTQLIKEGNIVAIKGIGGFHIVCDASNDLVIQQLREYKHRPSKPFAIMCKDIKQISTFATISSKENELLLSKESPIVVLDMKSENKIISNNLAPKIERIGCFLPYTALHHLLFEYLENPIVATSANRGGEPIITAKEDIISKLPFIEYIVDFNRKIINAVDDSVVQVVDNDIQPLRTSRGYSPTIIKLKKKLKQKILAVGANAKNTISIAFDDTIIVSPYIGDLDSLVAFEYFKRTVETFQKFYDFVPDIIVCDKHPNYHTTVWAKQQNFELVQVQHHLSHIYATKAEYSLDEFEYVGFSFDGTGYGNDGTLWGGEVFVNDERKYHFKQIKLLGSQKAIKEPRRVALSMLFDRYSLDEVFELDYELLKSFSTQEIKMLHQSYTRNLNAPLCSSVGRLFDAMASFTNLIQIQSYEGEAGLLCETQYDKNDTESFEFSIKNGIIDIVYDFTKTNLISIFINTLAEIIVFIAQKEKKKTLLTGGVFQNKTLLNLVIKRLKEQNIEYCVSKKIPLNDSGISLGQLYYVTTHLI